MNASDPRHPPNRIIYPKSNPQLSPPFSRPADDDVTHTSPHEARPQSLAVYVLSLLLHARTHAGGRHASGIASPSAGNHSCGGVGLGNNNNNATGGNTNSAATRRGNRRLTRNESRYHSGEYIYAENEGDAPRASMEILERGDARETTHTLRLMKDFSSTPLIYPGILLFFSFCVDDLGCV